MLDDNSASKRKGTPHTVKSTSQKALQPEQTITRALKRRARALIKDRSVDPQSRAVIRYGLAIDDPWLPELVRRAEAGQSVRETIGRLATAAR